MQSICLEKDSGDKIFGAEKILEELKQDNETARDSASVGLCTVVFLI